MKGWNETLAQLRVKYGFDRFETDLAGNIKYDGMVISESRIERMLIDTLISYETEGKLRPVLYENLDPDSEYPHDLRIVDLGIILRLSDDQLAELREAIGATHLPVQDYRTMDVAYVIASMMKLT